MWSGSGHVMEQSLLHTINPRSEGHIVTDLSSGQAGSHWALGVASVLGTWSGVLHELPPESALQRGVIAGPEAGLRDPTFQTESTSLEPGPCKTDKTLGTFLPPLPAILSPTCFLSSIPFLVLYLRLWRSTGCTAGPPHFGHY